MNVRTYVYTTIKLRVCGVKGSPTAAYRSLRVSDHTVSARDYQLRGFCGLIKRFVN